MNNIECKFKIVISFPLAYDVREFISPAYTIWRKETVDFDNKAYQNLIKNLGMKEKSIQNSHYNDLLLTYPYVKSFFKGNRGSSLIEGCKKGTIQNITLHLYIRLPEEGYDYKYALFAIINKDGSGKVIIEPPFQKQEAGIGISGYSTIKNHDRVEKKGKSWLNRIKGWISWIKDWAKDKDLSLSQVIFGYGLLTIMLLCSLIGLFRAIIIGLTQIINS